LPANVHRLYLAQSCVCPRFSRTRASVCRLCFVGSGRRSFPSRSKLAPGSRLVGLVRERACRVRNEAPGYMNFLRCKSRTKSPPFSVMSKRTPGLGSLLTGAAWSVRLKLIVAAVILIGTGFASGWVYRWITEPLVPPEPSASASVSPVPSMAGSTAPAKPIPRPQTLYVLNAHGTITEYPSGSGGDI